MKKKPRRSICPVSCTLDLIGDKWTLLVVRDLMCGKSHFKDFSASPEGIASNILTDRLDRLLDAGLVEQYESETRAGTFAYRLTRKGWSLGEILESLVRWGLEHLEGTEARMKPQVPDDL